MGKKIKLDALARGEEKIAELRKAGFVLAVFYGNGKKNLSLKIKEKDFNKAYAEAGESSLIDLNIDGKETKVIIREVQTDAIKNKVLHVDFYAIDMKKELEVEIPLVFLGESRAVKELGGTLMRVIESVEVRCLPSDLVEHIDVDLSVINDFSDHIRISDLKLPTGMELVSNPEDMVALVERPRTEAEQAALEAGDQTATVPAEVKEGEEVPAAGAKVETGEKKSEAHK